MDLNVIIKHGKKDDIGYILKYIRKSRKLSLKEVGKNVGVSRSTLSKYEKNYTKMPVTIFFNLVTYYEVDIDDII